MRYELMDKYIGEKLKEQRKILGLSLADVGTELGIPRQRYCNYESGIRSMPFLYYEKACKVLKIDSDQLFVEARDYMKKETYAGIQEEQ